MTVVQMIQKAQKWYKEITDLSISKENGGLSSARNAELQLVKENIFYLWTQMIFYIMII
jgi:hypothetical protein